MSRIHIRSPHPQLKRGHAAELTVGPQRLLTGSCPVIVDLLGGGDVVLDVRHTQPVTIK